jgi:GxxExxY protein
MLYKELTSEIINTFYTVYNELGYGFLEKVFECAIIHELEKRGIKASQQLPIKVFYDGIVVGSYYADLVVEEKVIVELKTAENISKVHQAQLLNYLKATAIKVGLLLNFGPKPTFKRMIFTHKENIKG